MACYTDNVYRCSEYVYVTQIMCTFVLSMCMCVCVCSAIMSAIGLKLNDYWNEKKNGQAALAAPTPRFVHTHYSGINHCGSGMKKSSASSLKSGLLVLATVKVGKIVPWLCGTEILEESWHILMFCKLCEQLSFCLLVF